MLNDFDMEGGIMAIRCDHALIPWNCDYVRLHGKWGIKFADRIKVAD